MYLSIVLVDYLDLQGNLQTTRVISNQNNKPVVVKNPGDSIHGENKDRPQDKGVRYHLSNCKVNTVETRLKSFHTDMDLIEFQFEHLDVPLLPVQEHTIGLYNLVLPTNFVLTDFHILDRGDEADNVIEEKNLFHYNVLWDKNYRTHLIRLEMKSERGSASFIVKGKAKLSLQVNPEPPLKDVKISEDIVKNIDVWGFGQKAKEIVFQNLERKVDWLQVKPNFFGLALNHNQIIQDAISLLKTRLQQIP